MTDSPPDPQDPREDRGGESRDESDAEAIDPDDFDQDAFDAAFAAEFGQTIEPERPEPEAGSVAATAPEPADESTDDSAPAATQGDPDRRIIAVVLTPIKSAVALAGVCAMTGVEAHVIPSSTGALAARTITGEVDEAELLLTGAPAEAVQMAQTISRAVRAQVLLLTANLGSSEDGPTGTITGKEYTAGEPGKDVPAGLVLANADEVLESLLIGTLDPAQAPGRVDPSKAQWRSGGLFGSRRRKKR